MKKEFSPELFQAYDSPARGVILSYLDRMNIYARNNPDKYGPDIIVHKGFSPAYYIEGEVKQAWKGGRFPFSTVNLPERKGRYTRKRLSIEYWILSADMKWVVIIPGSKVNRKFLQEVPNKYIREGEKFYQIPIELCEVRSLENGDNINSMGKTSY